MKKEGYYSSGEFARMAHVTLRTIRYYDKQNILKPSYVSDAGARFYTDEDLARLQQILLLKFLGFSLDDIRDMTINDTDYHFMRDSLDVQLKLVRDRIEQLQLVEKAIQDTSDAIQTQHTIDWNQMLDLIHLTGMEKSMKNQYQNATNIAARIKLHSLYSINKEGWFPWIYSQCHLQSGTGMWGRCFMETKHLSASSEHPPYPLRHLRRDAARCKTCTGSQRFPVFFRCF